MKQVSLPSRKNLERVVTYLFHDRDRRRVLPGRTRDNANARSYRSSRLNDVQYGVR